jgi:AmmeMemoRadiSam system protein B
MSIPLRPRLRPVEISPIEGDDEALFALVDPEGFGETVVVPHGGVLLAMLMDGRRTLAALQAEFQAEAGIPLALSDLKRLVQQLDAACLLEGERFEARREDEIRKYLAGPTRPAAFAGSSYAARPDALRKELAGYFGSPKGAGALEKAPDPAGPPLCAVLSPHIDPYRGGPAYAGAYRQMARRSPAELFVIFGTAHRPMENSFSVTRKDFETPLGLVKTDGRFIDRLAGHLASSVAGRQIDLFADELVHRNEHSIEFQALFLQYVLGPERPLAVVPVLVDSFYPLFEEGISPDESPEMQAFLAAVRAAAQHHPGGVCYVSGADLAHVGRRFGDEWTVDARRREEQAAEDRRLLETICRGDAAGLFRQVAAQQDRRRICGLAPTYTLLEVIGPARGELLAYDQAVDADGSGCVTFASVAFYPRSGP